MNSLSRVDISKTHMNGKVNLRGQGKGVHGKKGKRRACCRIRDTA